MVRKTDVERDQEFMNVLKDRINNLEERITELENADK